MNQKNISILAVQETHVTIDQRETRKHHQWFFSGSQKTTQGQNFEAGVAFVLSNKVMKHVKDIEPVSDRILKLVLDYAADITFINCYAPQAYRSKEDKDSFYNGLRTTHKTSQGTGPTFILGDFNARVQKAINAEERQVFGPNAFEITSADPLSKADEVIENRSLFLELCMENKLKAMKAENITSTLKERVYHQLNFRGVNIKHHAHVNLSKQNFAP